MHLESWEQPEKRTEETLDKISSVALEKTKTVPLTKVDDGDHCHLHYCFLILRTPYISRVLPKAEPKVKP